MGEAVVACENARMLAFNEAVEGKQSQKHYLPLPPSVDNVAEGDGLKNLK